MTETRHILATLLAALLALPLLHAAPPKKKPAAHVKAVAHRAAAAKAPAVKAAGAKTAGAKTSKTRRIAAGSHKVATPVRPAPVAYESREAITHTLIAALAGPSHGLENPAALAPFFERLHGLQTDPQSGVVRILQFGDSHTASDTFTGPLRDLFQHQFGDGGAGYSYPGYPFPGYRIHGTRRSQSSGWFVTGTHFRDLGDGLLGMGGVSLSTSRPGQWVDLEADAVSVEVQYLVQPGGGTIELYDGDQLLQTISTDGPTAAGHFDIAVAPGPHQFEVRTTSSSPVRLFGLRTEEASGITVESMGLNGAEASLLLKYDEALAQTFMEQRDASLIILAYGTNEAADPNWTEESYAAMFRRLVERMRSLAPNAAILVVGPADRELRSGTRRHTAWTASVATDRIVRAQRAVCREMNCAYWDERTRMGGFGSMRDWVAIGWGQPDHTHFTQEGYTELAAALFSDILREYNSTEKTQ